MHFFIRVITSPITVRRIILLHVITTLAARASLTTEQQKCTENDPRHPYNDCMIDKYTVWCDLTSFKKIPSANTINSFFESKTDCRNATLVYVNDSCITDIEQDDLKDFQLAQIITFEDNMIIELKSGVFQNNKHLVRLDICKNRIGKISASAFHGLTKLTHLNLARNQLTDLESGIFHELHYLEDLTLDHNFLSTLIADQFSGVRNLKVLKIRGNRIASIDVHAFRGLRRLSQLQLDGNDLKSLDSKIFHHLRHLEVLTLSHNKLHEWPQHLGSRLPNLHSLDLSHNLISEFNATHVANTSKLQNLSLKNNSIAHIDENLFLSTPRLGYLNLSQNRIEKIPAQTFSHLCYLKTLILSGNRLKTPHTEWFITMVNLSQSDIEVNLEGNIWDCHCNAIKHWAYISDLQSLCDKTSCVLDIDCQTPAKFENRSLKSLNKSELDEGDCKETSHLPEPKAANECKTPSFKVEAMPRSYVMPIPRMVYDPEVHAALKPISSCWIIAVALVLLVGAIITLLIWWKMRVKRVSVKKKLPSSKDDMLEEKQVA